MAQTERTPSAASLLGGIGGIRLVMNELRALGVEGRKRNDKVLKESAERALMKLQQLEEEHGQNPDAYVAAVRATPDILSPFLLVLAAASTPLHMIAGFVSSVMASASSGTSSATASILGGTPASPQSTQSPGGASAGSTTSTSGSVPTSSSASSVSASSKKTILTGAIGAIQMLVSYGAVSTAALPEILRVLEARASERSVDDTILLKLLQTVTAVTMLLTTPKFDEETRPLVRQALAVVFKVHARKSPVKTTAAATLRQLLVSLFDSGSAKDREVLVSDLSSLVSQEAPVWLPVDALDSAFGLELIECILLSKTIDADSASQNICPVVFKSQKLVTDFPHFVRVQRIILHYVTTFYKLNPPECEVFLSRQARLLDLPLQSAWYHALVLEVLARVTNANHGMLFYLLYQQYRSTNLIDSIVLSLGHFVQNMFAWPVEQFVFVESPSPAATSSSSNAALPTSQIPSSPTPLTSSNSLPVSPLPSLTPTQSASTVQNNSLLSAQTPTLSLLSTQRALLHMLSAVDPPDQISNAYLVSLALQSIVGVCLACRHCQMEDQSFVDTSVWPSVLPALALLLSKTFNLALVKQIFVALTNLTDTTGNLNLSTPQQVIITSFVKEIQPTLISSITSTQLSPLLQGAPPVAQTSMAEAVKWLQSTLPAPVAPAPSSSFAGESGDESAHHGEAGDGSNAEPSSSGAAATAEKNKDTGAGGESETSTGSGGGGGSSSSFKYLLTFKNLETITGLFTLIQRSGSSLLAETWPIVLDALDLIEKWYCVPAAAGDPVGLGMLITGKQTQLIQHQLPNIFQATSEWPLPKLRVLTESIIKRLLALPNTAPLQPSIMHLYKICQYNVTRVDAIWTPSLVEAFKKAQANDLIIQLIRASCSTSLSDLLLVQLTVLEEMARTVTSTTLACLQTVVHLMQSSSGTEIDGQCWQLILGLLMSVTVSSSSSNAASAAESINTLNLAFNSLELIVTDFLPNLAQHPGSLALAISTIGCFARQALLDSNPSLTAIQDYLWNIADYVASDPVLNTDHGVLWLAIFRELQYLCTDHRHEIRSAAVVTLFKTTSAHSRCLSIETWAKFFHEILFPVLHKLHSKSVAMYQSDENPAEFAMGQDRSMQMLVHHTRDSPAKLWSETCVQALRHATKLMTASAGASATLVDKSLSRIPNFFDGVWTPFFSLLEIFAPHNSKEVSSAAIDCVGELFCHALVRLTDEHRNQCWEASWLSLEQIASSARRFPSTDNRLRLVQAIEHIFAAVAPFLSDARQDHQRLVRLALVDVYFPHIELSVSRSLFTFVESQLAAILPPLVFEDLILAIAKMLDQATRAAPRPEPEPTSKYDRPRGDQPNADVTFMLAALRLLASDKIFAVAPLAIQAICIPALIPVFSTIMQSKFSKVADQRCGVRSPLWKEAVAVLLGMLARHHSALSSVESCWDPLLSAFEDFLFPSLQEDLYFDESVEEVSYRINIIQVVANTLLPHAPEVMIDRLLELLRVGSTLFDSSEQFASACCRAMFELCSTNSTTIRLALAHRMTPALIAHCKLTLNHFVSESKLLSSVPMPVARLNEVLFLLRELRDLHIVPEVNIVSPNHCLAFPLRKSTRMHLFVLMPTLSVCIQLSQQEIRTLVSEIFMVVSEELQL